MNTLSVAALTMAGSALMVGCDAEPSVLFVADSSPIHLLQLTDAQQDCDAPRRQHRCCSWRKASSGAALQDPYSRLSASARLSPVIHAPPDAHRCIAREAIALAIVRDRHVFCEWLEAVLQARERDVHGIAVAERMERSLPDTREELLECRALFARFCERTQERDALLG